MINKRLAVAMAGGLLLGGLAVATAGAATSRATTPVTTDMFFGSSGNIVAKGAVGAGTVGSVLPNECELVGVGDYIGTQGCPGLLGAPYQLTETPISVSGGIFTYFTVTTTNAAPSAGNRINFSIRLCEAGANVCNPAGGITSARCSPLAGSKTCSWTGRLPFQQWLPSTAYPCTGPGVCHGKDPGFHDEGLIDIVLSRGCGTSCPNGTYDPGHVSWSAAYLK
jgi:hypothetical protein